MVTSEEGSPQGDPCSGLLFDMAIHDRVVVAAEGPGVACNLWYQDDGHIAGTWEGVCAALERVKTGAREMGMEVCIGKYELYGQVRPDALLESMQGIRLVDLDTGVDVLGVPLGE